MRNVIIIARRELAAYFSSPLAYVFIVIFLALAGALGFYLGAFFDRGQADLGSFFLFHPWLFISWCRRSACGCGRKSGARARSSC